MALSALPDYHQIARDWLYRNSSDDGWIDGWINLDSSSVEASLARLLEETADKATLRTHDFYARTDRLEPREVPARAWFSGPSPQTSGEAPPGHAESMGAPEGRSMGSRATGASERIPEVALSGPPCSWCGRTTSVFSSSVYCGEDCRQRSHFKPA